MNWKRKERVVLKITFSFLAVRQLSFLTASRLDLSENAYVFQYTGSEMLYHPTEGVKKKLYIHVGNTGDIQFEHSADFPICVSRPTPHFPLSFCMFSFSFCFLWDASTVSLDLWAESYLGWVCPVGDTRSEDERRVKFMCRNSKSSQPLLAPGCFTNSFWFWFLLSLYTILIKLSLIRPFECTICFLSGSWVIQ